jgi:hypothetical protein
MDDIIDVLKAKARQRHKRAGGDDKRRHHLAAIAKHLGFAGWQHLVAVLKGDEAVDFGTLMYAPACSAHFNIWSASYDEASAIRSEHGGWLLPYRHQFVIVDRHFIETLGLDPDDADWSEMGRDWVKPASVDARQRLCARLVRARAEQSACNDPEG